MLHKAPPKMTTKTNPQEARSDIDYIPALVGSAYRSLGVVYPGFKPREEQQLMIKRVNGLISKSQVGVIQAPTGTGKSLGYLIPGIINAAMRDRVLIVSTATASLQEQLSKRDIPDALKAIAEAKVDGVSVNEVTIAVAKGRGRYVCPLKLELNQEKPDMFREETAESKNYQAVQELLDGGIWDGSRDSMKVPMPEDQWRKIANDAASCTGKNCRLHSECPFYTAMKEVTQARVIVTNHDYLFTSISKMPEGPLAKKNAIFIFDEAHHLSDKIIASFATTLQFGKFWDKEVENLLPWLNEDREIVDMAHERVKGLWIACERMTALMVGDGTMHRFTLGEPPPQFAALIKDLGKDIDGLKKILIECRQNLSKRETERRVSGVATIVEMNYGKLLAEVDEASACIRDFVSDGPRARWLAQTKFGVEICCSPFDAAAVAKQYLWPVAKNAILTSATFAPLGNFSTALRGLGLGESTSTLKLDSPFDYSRATLRVPKMTVEGSDPNHGKRVKAYLAELLAGNEHLGVLVYFTSKKLMAECFEALTPKIRPLVLMQGDLQTSTIIKRHREKIDAKERSIIFGLDSFGEGIDLPGEYCTRVVITKLPFPQQDDPVTATHSEQLKAKGLNAFNLLTLPKAGLKFAQVVGRLMRRETDYGDVLVLDKRLVSKTYGKQMMAGTPFETIAHC